MPETRTGRISPPDPTLQTLMFAEHGHYSMMGLKARGKRSQSQGKITRIPSRA